MVTLIGISGHISSGKDTVGEIIKYHTSGNARIMSYEDHLTSQSKYRKESEWEIKKFADALKDIVCILTGCTREQLEDINFKNSLLPEEWIRYGYADGFIKEYIGDGDMGKPIMKNKQCDKERYEIELRTNWQTAYKTHFTYRELLQQLGTNLFRKQLNEDVWVNALFSKYNYIPYYKDDDDLDGTKWDYPKWIITDVRFPNEAKAIKARGGIVIRIERPDYIFDDKGNRIISTKEYRNIDEQKHISEIALDDYEFDYSIYNNDTMLSLMIKVKDMLKTFKIIS